MTPASRKTQETLRRFGQHVPLKTLARYLIQRQTELYLNKSGLPDVELARSLLRYWAGKQGEKNREKAKNKSNYRSDYKMPPPMSAVRTPYKLPEELWLVLSDIHVPFHSIHSLEVAFDYAKVQGVSGILLNGDFQDCQAVSYFHVARRDFPMEVELTIDMLDFIRNEFPEIPILWKPGNHEDRLAIYYSSYAPQLSDLPTSNLETILGLEQRNIVFLDRKQKIMAGKLPILHGHELRGGSNSVSPARWLFLKAKGNAMCGHFHRPSTHREATINHKNIVTWTTGCLCTLEPDYNPEANNWSHGFALVHVEKGGGFDVENLEILQNGRVVGVH